MIFYRCLKIFFANRLVAGDVEGNFDALFKRVETISKKSGPFDMLLCVGDFFCVDPKSEQEWMQYSSGAKKGMLVAFLPIILCYCWYVSN